MASPKGNTVSFNEGNAWGSTRCVWAAREMFSPEGGSHVRHIPRKHQICNPSVSEVAIFWLQGAKQPSWGLGLGFLFSCCTQGDRQVAPLAASAGVRKQRGPSQDSLLKSSGSRAPGSRPGRSQSSAAMLLSHGAASGWVRLSWPATATGAAA